MSMLRIASKTHTHKNNSIWNIFPVSFYLSLFFSPFSCFIRPTFLFKQRDTQPIFSFKCSVFLFLASSFVFDSTVLDRRPQKKNNYVDAYQCAIAPNDSFIQQKHTHTCTFTHLMHERCKKRKDTEYFASWELMQFFFSRILGSFSFGSICFALGYSYRLLWSLRTVFFSFLVWMAYVFTRLPAENNTHYPTERDFDNLCVVLYTLFVVDVYIQVQIRMHCIHSKQNCRCKQKTHGFRIYLFTLALLFMSVLHDVLMLCCGVQMFRYDDCLRETKVIWHCRTQQRAFDIFLVKMYIYGNFKNATRRFYRY